MAIALVATAGSGVGGTQTTSCTVTIPAATLAGHELVLCLTSRLHTNVTAYPAVVDNDTGGDTWAVVGESASRQITVWRKKATSGTASKTITITGCVNSCCAVLGVYSGAFSGDPLGDFATEANNGGDETTVGTTPTYADSLILYAMMHPDDIVASTVACTDPGSLTLAVSATSTGGSDCSSSVWTAQQVGGPTATGNFTYTLTPDDACRVVVFTMRTDPNQIATAGVANAALAALDSTVSLGGVTATTQVAPVALSAFDSAVTLGNVTATAAQANVTVGAFDSSVSLGGVVATAPAANVTLAAYDGLVTLGGVTAATSVAPVTLGAFAAAVTLGAVVATPSGAAVALAAYEPAVTIAPIEWWQLRLRARSGPALSFATQQGPMLRFRPR